MPEISRFYGIIIKMFFKPKEHEPAHIHAVYGEYIGEFNINTFKMLQGDLPKRAQNLISEWIKKYQSDLQKMWDEQKISKLPPLEWFEVSIMIVRIKKLEPLKNFLLRVEFTDGKIVLYDVKDDIESLPGYSVLKTTYGLFNQVQVDESRTCIFWNDEIDLPADAVYNFGKPIENFVKQD